MQVHCRVTPCIKFDGTHLYMYTWVGRGAVKVKCLAQEHNTMFPARDGTRSARSRGKRTNHEAQHVKVHTAIFGIMCHHSVNCLKTHLHEFETILAVQQHSDYLGFSLYLFISTFYFPRATSLLAFGYKVLTLLKKKSSLLYLLL